MAPPETTSLRCDEVWEDDREDCPQCGGSGLDDTQCECGDDTCCCLVPSPVDCSWCAGADYE